MTENFNDKVVLITGGASGLGEACAQAFAAGGGRVAVADVSSEAVAGVVDRIEAQGGQAIGVTCDVTDSSAVEGMVKRVVDTWGRLDVGVNSAGIVTPITPVAETEEGDFDRLMAVNVKGVWLSMRGQIRQMLEQGGGSIVNMASALSIRVHPGSAFYVASKFAVAGLTRTAAVEYAQSGIRINAICPGNIKTPMFEKAVTDPETIAALQGLHPMNRLGKPEEVAAAVMWLASDAASFTTGSLLTADGGWTAT